jgi:ABC-type glutathione transport system ATPase component
MTSPTLEIRGLTVALSKNGASLPILRDVDVAVASGEVLGLLGDSGCGKSMTALAILGLLPEGVAITAGSILFQGKEVTAKLRGKHIAMIFQEPMTSLNPLITV